MFRHRQHLRCWAARVLLLWLLGLGASVAHGCLAPVQVAPAAVASSPVDSAPAQDPSASHHCAPDQQGNLAKANCQDFCAKASVSVPTWKSALDDMQSPAVITLAGLTVQPVLPALAPVLTPVARQEGVRAPPIPIAFLRLAL